jgi:hypothetical protein
MVIIIVLKLDLGVDPGQGLSHKLGLPLTWVNTIKKMVIIIILKLNSRVNSE